MQANELAPPFFWLGRDAVDWDELHCSITAYVPTPDGLKRLEEEPNFGVSSFKRHYVKVDDSVEWMLK